MALNVDDWRNEVYDLDLRYRELRREAQALEDEEKDEFDELAIEAEKTLDVLKDQLTKASVAGDTYLEDTGEYIEEAWEKARNKLDELAEKV